MRILLLAVMAFLAVGCSDAEVASKNLSKASDMFEIDRRVVFYNGISGEYILTVEGRCSIRKDGMDGQLEVTCKTGRDEFKKHYLGISDNVTYFAEQLEASSVDTYRYRVLFKPEVIAPDIDLETSVSD